MPGSDPTEVGIWERFERNETIIIDGKGGMTVSAMDFWPNRCLRISQEDLTQVTQHWQPLLESLVRSHTTVQVMANPYTGDEWRPNGPLLWLSFGSPEQTSIELLWDGTRSLPKDLDTAVIGTLEVVCSNSRLAKGYLLRGLPRQVADRLECLTN